MRRNQQHNGQNDGVQPGHDDRGEAGDPGAAVACLLVASMSRATTASRGTQPKVLPAPSGLPGSAVR
jgi:hypothetical protein